MENYYIETVNGRRGPYTAEDITRGVRQGTIPLGARLVDDSGKAVTAVEVIRAGQPQAAPVDSGPHTAYQASRPMYPPPPAYPQQPSYPQQSYPYPGNAGQYPQQQGYQPYGHPMPQPVAVTPATSGLAIASLTLSLTTLVFCLPLWIGGVICGLMALGQCQPHGPKQGRGMALAGIWIGVALGLFYVGVIAWFLIAMQSGGQTW